jgi:hypothetical protein
VFPDLVGAELKIIQKELGNLSELSQQLILNCAATVVLPIRKVGKLATFFVKLNEYPSPGEK